jgi:hypothetical protein
MDDFDDTADVAKAEIVFEAGYCSSIRTAARPIAV